MHLVNKYETVIGLEVHAQLATNSKLFCEDPVVFGSSPNSSVSAISLGHPGTLPRLNSKAIEYAIRMGLICQSEITRENYFARKNYFYPDLPKGYQITQHATPICVGGLIEINGENDNRRKIRLHHIHLEEDAGKSLHEIDENFTCLDFNRAGTPLIEIVSEPDMRSGEEAFQFLSQIRKLVKWIGICDANMEEGSLRCDANISIRLKGEDKLGTKVEVKNLNSIRNLKKAIEFESERLMQLAELGQEIVQETRSFDAATDTTFSMREKENANDYRYFTDPDLPPFFVSDEMIEAIRSALPLLPEQYIQKYIDLGLREYDANLICREKEVADFFEGVLQHTKNFKAAANWLNGPVSQFVNQEKISIVEFPLTSEKLAELIDMVESGQVGFSAAAGKLFPALLKNPGKDVFALASEMQLLQTDDKEALETWTNEVLEAMADKVIQYKKGKKGLLGVFVGEVRKRSKGKADLQMVTALLQEKLNG